MNDIQLDQIINDIPDKKLLLPREVRPILRISLATVYRWCDIGILKSIKIRGTRRISKESVIERLKDAEV